jgi:hypothetical protein
VGALAPICWSAATAETHNLLAFDGLQAVGASPLTFGDMHCERYIPLFVGRPLTLTVITRFFFETLFCGEIVTFVAALAPVELMARNAIDRIATNFFIHTP